MVAGATAATGVGAMLGVPASSFPQNFAALQPNQQQAFLALQQQQQQYQQQQQQQKAAAAMYQQQQVMQLFHQNRLASSGANFQSMLPMMSQSMAPRPQMAGTQMQTPVAAANAMTHSPNMIAQQMRVQQQLQRPQQPQQLAAAPARPSVQFPEPLVRELQGRMQQAHAIQQRVNSEGLSEQDRQKLGADYRTIMARIEEIKAVMRRIAQSQQGQPAAQQASAQQQAAVQQVAAQQQAAAQQVVAQQAAAQQAAQQAVQHSAQNLRPPMHQHSSPIVPPTQHPIVQQPGGIMQQQQQQGFQPAKAYVQARPGVPGQVGRAPPGTMSPEAMQARPMMVRPAVPGRVPPNASPQQASQGTPGPTNTQKVPSGPSSIPWAMHLPIKIFSDVPTHGVGKITASPRLGSASTVTVKDEDKMLGDIDGAGGATSSVSRKRKLTDLVKQTHALERLDPETEEFLLEVVDDFIDQTVQRACKAAKHRNSRTLGVKDLQLELERHWNLRIPGFPDELRSFRRPATNTMYQNRLLLVNKAKAAAAMERAKAAAAATAGSAPAGSAVPGAGDQGAAAAGTVEGGGGGPGASESAPIAAHPVAVVQAVLQQPQVVNGVAS
ncbi:hypothetical protein HK104_003662 [Borealophlyctis nickersoniae]|nr:hypothetical protein HK104_003662 [Borealophlyctis nickersoniae]